MTPSQYDTAEIGKKEGMKEKANKCEQINLCVKDSCMWALDTGFVGALSKWHSKAISGRGVKL